MYRPVFRKRGRKASPGRGVKAERRIEKTKERKERYAGGEDQCWARGKTALTGKRRRKSLESKRRTGRN